MTIYAIVQLENDRQETVNIGVEVSDKTNTKIALVNAMKNHDVKNSAFIKYSSFKGSLDSLEETFEFATRKFLGDKPFIVKETASVDYETKLARIINLASYAHEARSEWIKYLFSKNTLNSDGSFTIPKNLVDRWFRQVHTPYSSLPENEKASNIEEANKILKIWENNS